MTAIARKRLVLFVAVAGLILAGVGLAVAGCERPEPRRHTVTIEANAFLPDDLTVRAGDTIVWVNRDFYPHTATEDERRFDSSAIPASESWTYTAETRGTFHYVCTYHPTMKGILRVR